MSITTQDAERISQLEQEVKELKDYIQKLQVEHVESISKERKRWAREDLDALAQHDKEVKEIFLHSVAHNVAKSYQDGTSDWHKGANEVLRRFVKIGLEQLQQGGE